MPVTPVQLSSTLLSPITTPGDSATIPLWLVFAVIWILGVVSVIVYHALRHGRFMKMVCRWSEPVSDLESLRFLDSLKSEMGIKAQVGLSVCQSITSPMLVGFFRPAILLPPIKIASGELSLILKHELIHFQRHDLWYKALILAATALHWFNPVVYLMAKATAVQCEISCDALVLRGADFEQRKQYGETIIGVVRSGAEFRTALSTNFYGGKKGMENRISSIMDTKNKKISIGILVAAIIATLGTGTTFAINLSSSERIKPTYAPMFEVAAGEDFPENQLSEPIFTTSKLSLNNSGTIKEHDIPINGTIIYSKEGGFPWTLEKGQTVMLDLAIVDRGFDFGQGTEIGYILNDGKTLLFSEQIKSGAKVEFTAPKEGDYYFYIEARSSDPLLVNSFSVD